MSSLNLVSWRCLAHDPAFLGLPGANQIADNDQLGRDAYAHLERFLDGQLADRFDERQPCPNRALGIVLARLRIAEIHRHAVAQVFGLGAEFIRTHLAALAATDFFTVEVLTLRGVVTYYVLFFIHLESRRVDAAGITAHPDEPWMEQIARNVTMDGWMGHPVWLSPSPANQLTSTPCPCPPAAQI